MVSASTSLRAAFGPARGIPNPLRLLFSTRPWLAAVFACCSFALGVFWFCVLVTLIATGFGLAITFFGIPLLLGTMWLWTWGARAERWRMTLFFGGRLPSPYRPLPAGSWWTKVKTFATDPAVWKDLAYLMLLFPIGIAEFMITTVVVTVPLALVSLPAWFLVTGSPQVGDDWFLPMIIGVADTMPEALLMAAIGLPALLLMPYVLVGMASAHLVLARALLGNREEELEARVDVLTESRSRAVDAALAERRRIERDLHDGAQQRLVALAMELGMAKIKMDTDPAAARRLVDEAHQEAKMALVEIRNLVRGIHPAVLTDRGLDAAISALAGRCAVPVAVDVELDGRLPETVESVAYFVVAEALTNVAKHSAASEAWVFVRRTPAYVTVEIGDNGLGGARLESGNGLAGLADRLAALDGRLTIDSQEGAGTRIRAEIPCGL